MATLSLLEEALRGGEQARQLEQRCRLTLTEAEKAVEKAVVAAPKFISSTREQHETHLNEAGSLQTQLDMLGESLDDVMNSSEDMLDRTKKETAKRKALDSLSKVIGPFVHVANALNRSDDISHFSFQQLETTLVTLQAAIQIAYKSNKSQLKCVIPELEERSDQVKVTMKSLYMNLYEIHDDHITIKTIEGNVNEDVGAASKSLSNVDLLKNAIEDLISELLRNDIATSLSKATTCVEEDLGEDYIIRWSDDGPEARISELLEFDLDDIDSATDADIDAMADNLDIGNAAARALRVYDVLRLKLIGESFSRDLAFALQSWFCNHVLPSTVVLSSRRDHIDSTTSTAGNDALHSRVAAVSAGARAIQASIRGRGVPSFVLIVEMDALEAKVGSECRAQSVLRTRKAIALFAAAAHENDEIVACPVASDSYVRLEARTKEYFAPCLVTKTGVAVHDAFVATRNDAELAAKGGSMGIATAMNAAAIECLRAYREDVPVQYMDDLRSSLRLKALYYADCTMFMHVCGLAIVEGAPEARMFEEEAQALSIAANRAMGSVRRTAERRLDENLNAACRNGALGTYGPLTRIQRNSALSAAFHAMREVITVFAQIVPTELAEIAAGRLLDRYLSKLCDEIAKLAEISAEGCEQIDGILKDADKNVSTLMDLVKGMETVRGTRDQPPESVQRMRQSIKKVHAIREILNSRMEDIAAGYRQGKYNGVISRSEVEYFIRAIFEDTALRSSFIADLDVSLRQETGEWNNSDW